MPDASMTLGQIADSLGALRVAALDLIALLKEVIE